MQYEGEYSNCQVVLGPSLSSVARHGTEGNAGTQCAAHIFCQSQVYDGNLRQQNEQFFANVLYGVVYGVRRTYAACNTCMYVQ